MCDCVSGAGAPDPEGAADPQSRATEEGGGAAEGGLFPLPVVLLRTLHLPVTHHWNPTALGRLRPRSDQIRRRCDFSKGSRLGCGRTQLEESHRFGLWALQKKIALGIQLPALLTERLCALQQVCISPPLPVQPSGSMMSTEASSNVIETLSNSADLWMFVHVSFLRPCMTVSVSRQPPRKTFIIRFISVGCIWVPFNTSVWLQACDWPPQRDVVFSKRCFSVFKYSPWGLLNSFFFSATLAACSPSTLPAHSRKWKYWRYRCNAWCRFNETWHTHTHTHAHSHSLMHVLSCYWG